MDWQRESRRVRQGTSTGPPSRSRGRWTDRVSGPPSSNAAEHFRLALDLWETGIVLQRQRLRRLHPDARADEIERRLNEWLQERPGAAHGDSTQRSGVE